MRYVFVVAIEDGIAGVEERSALEYSDAVLIGWPDNDVNDVQDAQNIENVGELVMELEKRIVVFREAELNGDAARMADTLIHISEYVARVRKAYQPDFPVCQRTQKSAVMCNVSGMKKSSYARAKRLLITRTVAKTAIIKLKQTLLTALKRIIYRIILSMTSTTEKTEKVHTVDTCRHAIDMSQITSRLNDPSLATLKRGQKRGRIHELSLVWALWVALSILFITVTWLLLQRLRGYTI